MACRTPEKQQDEAANEDRSQTNGDVHPTIVAETIELVEVMVMLAATAGVEADGRSRMVTPRRRPATPEKVGSPREPCCEAEW